LRDYNGFNFDLHETGKEVYRVLKEGGIAVMGAFRIVVFYQVK
jgi:hypothetical protein